MKKWGILAIITVTAIVIGIVIGVVIGNNNSLNSNLKAEKILAQGEQQNTLGVTNILTVSTSSKEEKTTPNTQIVRNITYKKCGHVISDQIDIPEEFVNLTSEEFKKKYNENWKIESFSSEKIVTSKYQEGICNEHYVLKENNGYLAIYSIDEFSIEKLQETTGIVLKYLPEDDLNKIRKGIYVNGKENLNTVIEDYE